MESLLSLYSFIFGTLIGSFLNVVILRLPAGKNLVTERSECPQCKSKLKWYHNIPLISFIFLRGKCGFCGNPISWRYPLIELMTGLVSLWIWPVQLTGETFGLYIYFFTLACIFICHFFIDLDHHLLLDKLNIYFLVLVVPFTLLNNHWTYWAIGGAVGFGVPLAVTWIFYKLRGQIGLGGGDIKLFGILGLLLGPTGVILTIFLSCMVGAVFGLALILFKRMTKDKPMAFGPFILVISAFQIFFPSAALQLQSWFFAL